MLAKTGRSLLLTASTVTLVLVAQACGHSDDADMNHEIDRAMTHTASIDQALEAHAETALRAGDLASMEAEESTHYEAMRRHMTELDMVRGDMGRYCMGAGDHAQDMRATMRTMMVEHERHRAAPRPDMAAARAEEERHVRELRGMMMTLRAAGDAMRHDASRDRCRH